MPTAASANRPLGRGRRLLACRSVSLLLASALVIGSAPPVASAPTSYTPAGIGAWLAASVEHIRSTVVEASQSRRLAALDTKARRSKQVSQPRSGPYAMNLFERGDFVSQQTEYWCVVASVQTMLNIMEPDAANRSRAFQHRLQFQARRLDQDDDDGYWRRMMGEERWRSGHHGLGLTDWVGLLNARGHGPYEVDRAQTRKHAIRKAARAVRLTGKPAGLVVWRGAHAWVMSGFEATADPARTDRYKITRVFIQDPWYPAVSSIWGPSRPPNTGVSVRALGQDYLRYDRPGRRHPKRDGRYMLILPVVSEPSAAG
jgi:hypothetical protein